MGSPDPARSLREGLARLRAGGWSAAVKVTVRAPDGITVDYIESPDGSWQRYGKGAPGGLSGPQDFADLAELDAYLERHQPLESSVRARIPLLQIRGREESDWRVGLAEVGQVSASLGEDTLAAFLKCFVGADRLKSLLQMFALAQETVNNDTVPGERNLFVFSMLVVGTLHELGNALQELENTKVHLRMNDRTAWEPLRVFRAVWKDHPVGKRMRNEAGHHLGNLTTYKRGLKELTRTSIDTPLLVGMGQGALSDFATGAWDVLLRGISGDSGQKKELDHTDLKSLLDDMVVAQREFYPALLGAFIEALDTVGVQVDRQPE
jgi:hypothetical protein